MQAAEFKYQLIKPDSPLAGFVDYLWMVSNQSGSDREIVVLPDGRVDILFSRSATEPFHIVLMGLGSEAERAVFASGTVIFGISLKLLAVEYLLHESVASLETGLRLPDDFWGFSNADMDNFDTFCAKASAAISARVSTKVDPRKRKLFELIYASNGAMPISELADKAGWSSRQINRYFNQYFGMSLKAYCTILRFRASFTHISEGKLFPEQNFADQAHFIKEVKKFAGVAPRELSRNENDRFIQFSALPKP